MSGTGSKSSDICSSVQELIVWYPGSTLDDNERRKVGEHTAECPACAGLLRFVTEFKEVLVEQYAPHPSAEALVSFAENRTAMEPGQRSQIEGHLAACSECKEQLAMLEEIERTDLYERALDRASTAVRDTSGDKVSWLSGFWEALKGGVLRPVPAAVYLALAVVVAGLYILGPLERTPGIEGPKAGENGLRSVAGSIPATLSGVVLLPDETYRTRRPGQETRARVRIKADDTQVLLLELTGLKAPPPSNQMYTIQLLREGTSEPDFVAEVMGSEFQDNYTLCLFLAAGALEAGKYAVTVLDPDGTPVFRSTIVAE